MPEDIVLSLKHLRLEARYDWRENRLMYQFKCDENKYLSISGEEQVTPELAWFEFLRHARKVIEDISYEEENKKYNDDRDQESESKKRK